jgi:hypothetical protein
VAGPQQVDGTGTPNEDSGREDGGRTKRVFDQIRRRTSAQPGVPPLMSRRWSRSNQPHPSGRELPRLETPINPDGRSSQNRSPMGRRYSDPGSPVMTEPAFGLSGSVPPPKQASAPDTRPKLGEPYASDTEKTTTHVKPRFFGSLSNEPESLTDTEVVKPVRFNTKRALTSNLANPPLRREIPNLSGTSDNETPKASKSGSSTPRYKRMKSHLALTNLNPQTHAWPGAGSWQDALRAESGDSSKPGSSNRRPSNRESHEGVIQEEKGQPSTNLDPNTPPPRREKSRRKRHIEGMAPPTPSGLGFVPTERELAGTNARRSARIPGGGPNDKWKEGKIVEEGFDWGNRESVTNVRRSTRNPKETPTFVPPMISPRQRCL